MVPSCSGPLERLVCEGKPAALPQKEDQEDNEKGISMAHPAYEAPDSNLEAAHT